MCLRHTIFFYGLIHNIIHISNHVTLCGPGLAMHVFQIILVVTEIARTLGQNNAIIRAENARQRR